MSKDDLVVVTGAGGFIGGHLVKVLQQRGHKKIRAVDVKPLAEWYQKHPGVENQVGDLALLEQRLDEMSADESTGTRHNSVDRLHFVSSVSLT